jgi:hyaluronoglucosaminidase
VRHGGTLGRASAQAQLTSAALRQPRDVSVTSARSGSPFAVRGVIEGFYGAPWTHEQRLDLIPFLAGRGMNTFAYGPKDDPLLRLRWREPYEGDDRERIASLVEACASHRVDFVYCISPGLSIEYSSDADVVALLAKLQSVAALGVSHFGLLLDDIPIDLQHLRDRAAYLDLVAAHVSLVKRVAAGLGPDHSLAVCPTLYWGRGDEDGIATFGRAIDPRIDLLWTGREICSLSLELEDAQRFEASTDHQPLYWDNYPVNDVAMIWELHVGPYQRRDPLLHRASRGIIANAMSLYEASKIPIATIADYLADPEGYEPEASWAKAVREVTGDDADAEAFALFADNVRSSCLSPEDAPVVTRALEAFGLALTRAEVDREATQLRALADRLLAAAGHLLRGPVRNRALIEESRPWLEAFELGAEAMRRMADLGLAGHLEDDARRELLPFLVRLRDARVRVFGDALDMALADLTDIHLAPGRRLVIEGGGNA